MTSAEYLSYSLRYERIWVGCIHTHPPCKQEDIYRCPDMHTNERQLVCWYQVSVLWVFCAKCAWLVVAVYTGEAEQKQVQVAFACSVVSIGYQPAVADGTTETHPATVQQRQLHTWSQSVVPHLDWTAQVQVRQSSHLYLAHAVSLSLK